MKNRNINNLPLFNLFIFYLFINNKEVSNFSYTFWSCSNLTGRGWEDIITNAEQNAIDGGFSLSKTQCFRNCNALTDYGQIPAAWK